jgi:DNA (cytosine-5)-methyltransferase 3A
MKQYVVISLFNGMGCIFQALDRVGIKCSQKISSEIDKYANIVNDANYPETIQMGSVCDINVIKDENGKAIKLISKINEVDLLNDEIIFGGGSPCQSFSFAGRRKGMSTKDEQEILSLEHYLKLKEEEFEFEGQSYLFWEYMRLLYEIKPKYFLLENVKMGEKWEKVLSKAIGINAIEINSALVSAQNRIRLYWTNIGLEYGGLFGDLVSKIKQPKDKKILLKHILEKDVDKKYFLSDKMIECLKSHTRFNKYTTESIDSNNKSSCISSRIHKMGNADTYIRMESINKSLSFNKNYVQYDTNGIGNNSQGQRAYFEDGKSGALQRGGEKSGQVQPKVLISSLNKNQLKKFNFNPNTNKSDCLTLAQGRGGSSSEYVSSVSKIYKLTESIRRLTPLECMRLQTVNDDYKMPVSDTQKYKMLGNGWTIDVISYIFSYIK